jgi:dienelactone hydrolase
MRLPLLFALALLAAVPANAADAVPNARATASTVHIEPVAAFPGAIFAFTPGIRRPTLIVLGGSEGGDEVAREFAPMFARLGYAVLGLPYYDPGYDPAHKIAGLPRAFVNVPVDRLQAVHDWLAKRPEVDPTRIGLWGVSKGAEFAMIASTRFDWVKAVVAVVPSDVVWEGWGDWTAKPATTASFAWDGKPLAFMPYEGMDAEMAKAARGEDMALRHVHDLGRAHHPERYAAARIPVETYRGRLLLIAGEMDQIWPSAEMARAIAERRTQAGLSTDLVVYPDAGHALAGDGTHVDSGAMKLGGTVDAIARDRRDAWARTRAFLAAALAPATAAAQRARPGG